MKEDEKRNEIIKSVMLLNPSHETSLEIIHVITKHALNKLFFKESYGYANLEGVTVLDKQYQTTFKVIEIAVNSLEKRKDENIESLISFINGGAA